MTFLRLSRKELRHECCTSKCFSCSASRCRKVRKCRGARHVPAGDATPFLASLAPSRPAHIHSMTPQLPSPQLKFFANLTVCVDKPHEVGRTARGLRRLIPILSGEAIGDGWRARVLPGGADFQLVVSDTLAELDARYVLETDGGDLIYVQNRHPLRPDRVDGSLGAGRAGRPCADLLPLQSELRDCLGVATLDQREDVRGHGSTASRQGGDDVF